MSDLNTANGCAQKLQYLWKNRFVSVFTSHLTQIV